MKLQDFQYLSYPVADEPKANSNKSEPMTVETVDNHIYFYSPVNEDRCLDLIKQIRNVDKSLRNEKLSRDVPDYPDLPIWLHIQSYGGSLFAGLSMIDQLQKIPSPIYSISEGCCASAATLIALSCDKKFILPNSFLLIHQFRTIHWGTHQEFKDEMRLQERLIEKLINFYVSKSNLKYSKIEKRLKHDYWMDAEEALEAEFVDDIYNHREQ